MSGRECLYSGLCAAEDQRVNIFSAFSPPFLALVETVAAVQDMNVVCEPVQQRPSQALGTEHLGPLRTPFLTSRQTEAEGDMGFAGAAKMYSQRASSRTILVERWHGFEVEAVQAF